MKLTHEMIQAGRSVRGGFKVKQLQILGLQWSNTVWPPAGWPKRLIGKEVSEEQYAQFLELRGRTEVKQNVPQDAPAAVKTYLSTATAEQLDRLESLIFDRRKQIVMERPYDEALEMKMLEEFANEGRKAWADVPDAVKWVRELSGDSPEEAANQIYEESKRDLS